MKNKIYNISSEDLSKIKENFSTDKTLFVAEIDGKEIKILKDYFDKINTIFDFPIPARGFDGYLDWMTDLDWLEKDGYAMVIYNHSEFMKNDLKSKTKIIKYFEDTVLPWWEKDV
ncbi:MAG: barstar family protein [Oscillospiraceae bacterium]|nr:barstar family protein [Oscillospiraceae bacterium]